MNRCVIIGNADIKSYEKIKQKISVDDYIVCCDGGLRHIVKLCVKPDFVIGDFDSYNKPIEYENIIELSCEKDDTDTFSAVKEMLKRGFSDFLFVGAIGNRFDHTFGNISILIYLDENGSKGVILDDYGEISLLKNKVQIKKNSCKYFSIITLEKMEGIFIKGAKYPLENAVIDLSWQHGISNEPENDTTITFEKGRGLLIKID